MGRSPLRRWQGLKRLRPKKVEKARKRVVKRVQMLQKKKDAEKQKHYKDLQKLHMQRVAEYKQADDIAKAIGRGVLNLKSQKADLRAKFKQESSEHKRELLEKQIDSVDAGLDNAENRFDKAKDKVQDIKEQQEVAKKKMEEAKLKCEACGELQIDQVQKEDLVVAKAKALAFAKAQIPKGALVLKSKKGLGESDDDEDPES